MNCLFIAIPVEIKFLFRRRIKYEFLQTKNILRNAIDRLRTAESAACVWVLCWSRPVTEELHTVAKMLMNLVGVLYSDSCS